MVPVITKTESSDHRPLTPKHMNIPEKSKFKSHHKNREFRPPLINTQTLPMNIPEKSEFKSPIHRAKQELKL